MAQVNQYHNPIIRKTILRTNNLPLYAMVGLFSVLPLRAAIAQNLAAETQTQEDSALQVEKIMVTAQKRGEDLQEVPLALSVLGNKELERGKADNFVEPRRRRSNPIEAQVKINYW